MNVSGDFYKRSWILVLALSGILFFYGLGERSFRNPDEGRYAEISSEMVKSGNWMDPKLYEIDYLRKPPLYYWLLASSFKFLGFKEFSARCVPALFGVLGVLWIFFFVQRTIGDREAFFSALILSVNVWYLQVSRYLVIDAVFCFWVLFSSLSFYLARTLPAKKLFYDCLFFAGLGMAFLAKGFLGIAFPVFAVLAYFIASRRFFSVLKEISWIAGIPLFLALTGPWIWHMTVQHPDFWNIFFVREHLQRLSADQFEHQEPFYFYFLLLTGFLMPWILFLGTFFRSGELLRSSKGLVLKFALISGLLIVGFLSLSRSKLPTYLLPAIPFFSIFLGTLWADWTQNKKDPRSDGIGLAKGALILLLFAGDGILLGWPRLAGFYLKHLPDLGAEINWMAGAMIVSAVVGFRSVRREQRDRLFYALIFLLAAASFPVISLLEKINPDYTTKPFAEVLKPRISEGDRVFIYDHPGVFYDFRFYLGAPVRLVGLEGELEISRENKSAKEQSLSRDEFYRLLASKDKLYCLIRKSDFKDLTPEQKQGLEILREDKRKILFRSGV